MIYGVFLDYKHYYLKKIVLLDVFSIAFSFFLRILAGTIGIGVIASTWLLITVIMLSLYLALAKRYNEMTAVSKKHRKVLAEYTPEFLNNLLLICATLSIGFYTLYVVDKNTNLFQIITIPLVLYGFFRYYYLIYIKNKGGDPTEILIKDKHILITVILWILFSFLGVQL